jgi:hypothetical protein
MTNQTRLLLIMSACLSVFVSTMTDDNPTAPRPGPLPTTEDNIKTMMSLVFEPSFEILKEQIGTDADPTAANFGDVKQHALILSEFSARLHDWPQINKFKNETEKQHYLKLEKDLLIPRLQRDAAQIYAVAQKKDFDSARKSFVAMTTKCNICHLKMKSAWVPVELKP